MSKRDERLSIMLRRLCHSLATPRELPDRQLLERFALFRDETAFDLLVRRHGPLVLGVCRRVLGDDHHAEDAFQATFLLLARKVQSIERRESVGSWLYGVAYHTSLKLRTQIGRRRRREREAAAARPLETSARGTRDLEAILDDELQRLPQKYRTPIVLCYLEGRTHSEAAVELGWPVGTVAGRLARARIMLRNRLVKRGVSLSVAALASLLAAQPASAAPLPLMQATAEAALAVAAGKTATGIISVQAAALTEGMVRTMLMTKFQTFAAMVLTIGLIGAGAGVGTYGVLAQTQEETKPAVAQDLASKLVEAQSPPERKQEIGEVLAMMRGHTGDVYSVEFTPDGQRLTSAGADGTVVLWDVASGRTIWTFQANKDPIWSLAFTPDGKLLASGADDGTVRFWEATTGKQVSTVPGHEKPVRSLAFSPDGRLLATGGDDRTVKLWDTKSGKELRGFTWKTQVGEQPATAIAYSPDGKLVAVAGQDESVRLLETTTGKVVAQHTAHRDRVTCVAFAPDGKTFAVGSTDHSASIMTTEGGKVIRRLAGHSDSVLSLAFSPDGKLLATASADGTVKLWDVATGKEVATLQLPNGKAVWSVKFAPDGTKVATADADKTVKLWKVETRYYRFESGDAKDLVGRTTKTAPAGDRLDQLVQELARSQKSNDQIVEALFLATLGRLPADTEKQFAAGHLAKDKNRVEAVADVLYSLTNTKEFAAHVQDLSKRSKRPQ
jgi:RNA polymerase sigma factor (sigma-70 family)